MKKIGISTGSFYDMNLNTEDTIQKIAYLGINITEIFIQSREELKGKFIHDLKKK